MGEAENAVQRACRDWYAWNRIPTYRINRGAIPTGKIDRKGNPVYRKGDKETNGFSDLHSLLPPNHRIIKKLGLKLYFPIPIYTECKRAKGGRQSDDQKRFEADVRKVYAIYILASDADLLEPEIKRQIMEAVSG